MKGDYSLLDIIRHEAYKHGIRAYIRHEEGLHLDAGIVKVVVEGAQPRYMVCDTDFSAFYITNSCMDVVDELMRVLSK